MKKSIILIGISFLIFLSCKKENYTPTTPVVTTTTSSGSTTTGSTSTTTKKDCEINHTATLKIVNTSDKDFFIYIEDVFIITSTAGTISTYNKVPSSSGLEIKAIQKTDYSDLRSITMPFSDCMVTEISVN